MNLGRERVFSTNQVSTSTNRTTEITFPAGFAFMSKPELRKSYESLLMDYNRIKREKESIDEAKRIQNYEERIKELETRNHFLENDNHRLRVEVIGYRMKTINEYRENRDAFMQVAI